MSLVLDFPHALGSGLIMSSDRDLSSARSDCAALISDFDHALSRFRSDSLLSSLTGSARRVEFPLFCAPLFDLYDLMFAATSGRFTPTIADSLLRMGYGHVYGWLGDEPVVWGRDVWRNDGEPNVLYSSRPVHLDFGAAGKGYLVDLLHMIVGDDCMINAAGDIFMSGGGTVALENPWNVEQAVGIVRVPHNAAVCASSPARRHWTALNTAQEVHHIVDATTSENPHDVAATWTLVRSEDTQFPTAWADALGTALFFCDPNSLLLPSIPRFEFARLLSTKNAQQSNNWPGEFFVK
ncbi:FAD:protein FMN transferase [Alloscardovia omnicolens]|uniref:FAD:protein FMN transferase n=1 Tax=Alloscardovia omnicolens TaxID=419015 RepID=UPI000664DA6E|nr:FAD:protein FMN transferase [Alloscardovia omnicolens]MBS6347132.1 FAD:protein FMN transferase [Alloscardovia omnicolens]PKY78722.1 hypothetical protein CYJ33_03600 [Alloscardovia omnicolens]